MVMSPHPGGTRITPGRATCRLHSVTGGRNDRGNEPMTSDLTAQAASWGLPRILHVDDEPAVLAGLRRQLRSQYEVVTATDGATAFELLQYDVRSATCACRHGRDDVPGRCPRGGPRHRPDIADRAGLPPRAASMINRGRCHDPDVKTQIESKRRCTFFPQVAGRLRKAAPIPRRHHQAVSCR
jgi:hypothetical protein